MKLQMILLLGLAVGVTSACQKETVSLLEEDVLSVNEESALKGAKNAGFVHGLQVEIDGKLYYFDGPADGENGEKDVPGHYWVQAGKNRVVGKHYNTGPVMDPEKWWSSDAKDGAYLYMVNGIIDTWSAEKAEAYYSRGYVHYHEFVLLDGSSFHPTKVVWLKHTAVTSFNLDGGPGAPDPGYEHEVTPGIDFEFPNNTHIPY